MKILEVTHNWEALGVGGAERSAGALTNALNRTGMAEASLVACVRPGTTNAGAPFGFDADSGTVLVESSTDWAFFSWDDPRYAEHWRDLLQARQPDVVHMHHYAQAGMELPALVKSTLPGALVAVTLHDYMAVCARSGQMVDNEGRLCTSASVRKCASCMGWDVPYVAARNHYVSTGLRDIDLFLSPSRFLASRYVDWGVDPAKMHVVPNALEPHDTTSHDDSQVPPGVLVVSYLGQHTPFKGIGVFLDSVMLLKRSVRKRFAFNLFGSGSERFGEDFARGILEHPAIESGFVKYMGPYANQDVGKILSATDAIVVPSIWWENSPVVIEEALAARVAVLCSDVGGMREKVMHGRDGWHFARGSATSLAGLLAQIAEDPDLVKLVSMRKTPSAELVARLHLELFHMARGARHNGHEVGQTIAASQSETTQ